MLFDIQVKACPEYKLLLIKIEDTRQLMMETAIKEGFTSFNTLKISQRLDLLLNKLELTWQKETLRNVE
ncbi:Spo0E family sporulation regulatory protein-aspartic acid phosphatase [Priestia aryabhattai]|uniref:Spo0E family sporulation regulatory protein-aspartic acid phosphatase n=1 Tax=Priestia aryabhattai TaxID=412384 RepID=UPI0036D9F7BA